MKYNIFSNKEKNNSILYIKYENGKLLELTRNYQHQIIKSNNYIFLFLNNELDKVFDINNKRFIVKKFEMQILYNDFKEYKRKQRKKALTLN